MSITDYAIITAIIWVTCGVIGFFLACAVIVHKKGEKALTEHNVVPILKNNLKMSPISILIFAYLIFAGGKK